MSLFKRFFLLSSLIVWGCSEPGEGLKVDVKSNTPVELSQVTDSLEVVLLETSEKSLLSGIFSIAVSKDFIFVLDLTRVLQFSRQGKFIRQVGANGKGPGEYIAAFSMAADIPNEILYISSFGKIASYSFQGELLSEFTIRHAESLYFNDEHLYALQQSLGQELKEGGYTNRTELIRITRQWKIEDSVTVLSIKNKEEIGSIPPKGLTFLSFSHGQAFAYYPLMTFSPTINNTLHQVTGNKIEPSDVLNFGFKTRDDVNNLIIFDIVKTDHHLFCDYYYQKENRLFGYDYKKKLTYNISGGFDDDVYHTGPIRIKFYDTSLGLCYFTKDGFDVVGKIKNVDESSNPVLFLFKLK